MIVLPSLPTTRFNPHPPLLAGETSPVDTSVKHFHFVSIHTRHYWRVKPRTRLSRVRVVGFNPHPPLLAGETILVTGIPIAPAAVSIHTRHYWRVKPCRGFRPISAPHCFNPHPPLLAGETGLSDGMRTALMFQSTPAITGG